MTKQKVRKLIEYITGLEETAEMKFSELHRGTAGKINEILARYFIRYGDGETLKITDLLQPITSRERRRWQFPRSVITRRDAMVYEIQKVIKKDILSEYVIIEDLFGDVLERIFGKTITQRQLSTMIRPDLRDLIKNAKNKQAIDTANKIQQMIIQKRPLSDIADHIDRSYPKTATSSSKRLAYTEDTFLVNEALQAVTGAKYYRYITAGDDRVCETCQALSGMRFAYADRVVGLNYPPMHPWCRCIALPEE